jgi:hypothetical protein
MTAGCSRAFRGIANSADAPQRARLFKPLSSRATKKRAPGPREPMEDLYFCRDHWLSRSEAEAENLRYCGQKDAGRQSNTVPFRLQP